MQCFLLISRANAKWQGFPRTRTTQMSMSWPRPTRRLLLLLHLDDRGEPTGEGRRAPRAAAGEADEPCEGVGGAVMATARWTEEAGAARRGTERTEEGRRCGRHGRTAEAHRRRFTFSQPSLQLPKWPIELVARQIWASRPLY